MRILRTFIKFAVFAAVIPFAKMQTPAPLHFEVVSIKPAVREQSRYHGGNCHGIDSTFAPEVMFSPPPLGRCVFPNTAFPNILEYVYKEPGKPPFPVSGGDKWVNSDSFEIQAEAEKPEATTEAQLQAMMQTFLSERFKLQFHRETHEEQGVVLVRAANGKVLPTPTGKETRPGPVFVHNDGSELVVSGEQIPLASFINFLSGDLHQPIHDETGLGGVYNIALHFTPSAGEPPAAAVNASDTPGPSLFAALQEQLGLRLNAGKVPVETFVIDHVERPQLN